MPKVRVEVVANFGPTKQPLVVVVETNYDVLAKVVASRLRIKKNAFVLMSCRGLRLLPESDLGELLRNGDRIIVSNSEDLAAEAEMAEGVPDAQKAKRAETMEEEAAKCPEGRVSVAQDDGTPIAMTATLQCGGLAVTMRQFRQWRRDNPDVRIAHIKGFGRGMGDFYMGDALAELSDFDVIAFDGDAYAESGFTALVPLFLRLSPEKRALAFKVSTSVGQLKAAWAPQGLWAQMAIVAVDTERTMGELQDELAELPRELPDTARAFFTLGRAALLATSSRTVVCLGGGGITGFEAEASLESGVSWTIFALSRGKREQLPSVLDWAARNEAIVDSVKLVRGKDPNEADAFADPSFRVESKTEKESARARTDRVRGVKKS